MPAQLASAVFLGHAAASAVALVAKQMILSVQLESRTPCLVLRNNEGRVAITMEGAASHTPMMAGCDWTCLASGLPRLPGTTAAIPDRLTQDATT